MDKNTGRRLIGASGFPNANGHVDHVLRLGGSALAHKDLAGFNMGIPRVDLGGVERVRILRVVKYFKSSDRQVMGVVVEEHVVIEAESVTVCREDRI